MKLSLFEKIKKLKLKLQSKKLIESSSTQKLSTIFWYKEDCTREESVVYLKDKCVGVFLIRKSESVKNGYVLSLKVPIYVNKSTVAHYLITKEKKVFSLQGATTTGQFYNLNQLVTYFASTRDTLPVLLNLQHDYHLKMNVDIFDFS